MTTRHRRQIYGRPRRPNTITTYGTNPVELLHEKGGVKVLLANQGTVLNNTRDEVLPRYHRDAEPGDPWLSPAKSEAVRALLIQIGAAQNTSSALNFMVDEELELRRLCEGAELTEAQTEAVLLVGEGWSQQAIARFLKINQATVSRRLSSGRRKLTGWLPVLVAHKLQTA